MTVNWNACCTCLMFVLLLIISLTAPFGIMPANARDLYLSVQTDQVDVYGDPWDGIQTSGMLGGFFAPVNISSPPDMAACVVTVDVYDCYRKGTEENPESFCHDSYSCEWTIDAPDSEFGIVIYDIDVLAGRNVSDLVDVFLVSPDGNASDALRESTRFVMNTVSPLDIDVPEEVGKALHLEKDKFKYRSGEAKRRERVLKVLTAGQCASTPCILTQSSVQLIE